MRHSNAPEVVRAALSHGNTVPLAVSLAHASEAVAAVCQGKTLDRVWPDEKARDFEARSLALAALRAYGRGDFILRQCMSRPPALRLRALLLVALQRLTDRPEHRYVTVDQAVKAARYLGEARAAAAVNAVLRGYLRQEVALGTALAAEPIAHWGLPGWWREQLQADHPANWQAIAQAGRQLPSLCVRRNVRRVHHDVFMKALAEAGLEARVLSETAYVLARPVTVSRLPGFAAGWCSVQDFGAQHAATLLAAAPGMRVLDACAAPGGKTGHLLECTPGLDLWALDHSAQRLRRVADNLARLGYTATLRVADACDPASWQEGAPFARILLDAPCTASGVLRRHPDAVWLRRASDIAGFAAQQRTLLDALWPALAPGGRLLYATCSVFAAENAVQITAFIARHHDARRLPTAPNGALDWQLLPCADHDGFYYALLEKAADRT